MNKISNAFALILPLSLIWACGSDSDTGNGGTGANGSGGSAASGVGGDLVTGGDNGSTTGGTVNGTAGTLGSGGTLGVIAMDLCGDTGCICSNGVDDDDDGLIDGLDPECTGPLDNDEGSFATGIPGDNSDPKWQDCFFDGNSGAGDDHCRYATECLTGDYEPDHEDCLLTDACLEFCGARTPNGCDCFGCCTVDIGNGESADIMTAGDACSTATINDEEACPRCQKSTECTNTCGTCELCPGKTVADLPAECDPGTGGAGGAPGGPGYTCDGGEQVCGDGLPECADGLYCALGCCIVFDDPN